MLPAAEVGDLDLDAAFLEEAEPVADMDGQEGGRVRIGFADIDRLGGSRRRPRCNEDAERERKETLCAGKNAGESLGHSFLLCRRRGVP